MNRKLLIRLFTLFSALILVLFLARQITTERVQAFLSALGLDSGGVILNLCENRVDSILFSDGRKIEEVKSGMDMKWVAYDPKPRELDYLEMEKWLGKYCRIPTKPIENPEQANLPTLLVFKYIDGRSKSIQGFEDRNHFAAYPGVPPFASSDLVEAFKELRRLAQFEEKP